MGWRTQGKLGRGEILECGLMAQVKAKPLSGAEPKMTQATSAG
jgi:hypothetical protein